MLAEEETFYTKPPAKACEIYGHSLRGINIYPT